MDEIEKKLNEIASKNRRSNIVYVLTGIAIIGVVVSLILYSNQKRLSLEKDQEIIKLQSETLLQQKEMNDSLKSEKKRYDSLKKHTEAEIHKLQSELIVIKNQTKNLKTKTSLTTMQKRVNKIDNDLHNSTGKIYKAESPRIMSNEMAYTIRLYSYNPDQRIKKGLISTLNNNKLYNLKVYPDWSKKPSFFSSTPTILYYSDQTRKEAEKLKNLIFNKYKIKFKIAKGAGLGVNEKERQNTFVIHYLNTSKVAFSLD